MKRLLISVIFVVVSTAGCGGMLDDEHSQRTVARTIVHLHGDSPPDVKTELVPTDQIAHEVKLRRSMLAGETSRLELAAAGIDVDQGCAGASLWISDVTNGFPDGLAADIQGNHICFFGQGTADLRQYGRFCPDGYYCPNPTWSGATKSYWAGIDPGYFSNGAEFFWEVFDAWRLNQNAGYIAQTSLTITLGSVPSGY